MNWKACQYRQESHGKQTGTPTNFSRMAMNKTMNAFKRIAINTGGGDAPGLIHAVVHAAHTHGWKIHDIRDGFDGLLHPKNYPDGWVIKLTHPLIRNIASRFEGCLGARRFRLNFAGWSGVASSPAEPS